MAESVEPGPDAVRALMEWHFHPATGSPFWLGLLDSLGFDPRTEVRSFEDIRRFPDISVLLRKVRPAELIPRGCGPELGPRVYESGGTTGVPKYVVGFETWFRELAEWRVRTLSDLGAGDTLGVLPSGPHMVSTINRYRAERIGGLFFTVDLDPRWVKRAIRSGRRDAAAEYVAHVVEQVKVVLQAQDIRYLVATPPLLEALVRDDAIVAALRDRIRRVTLGGTQIDIDTVHVIRDEYLPDTEFVASYGSTSVLAEAGSAPIRSGDRAVRYEPFAPAVTFDVVDAAGQSVPSGERGRVCATHLSKYAFFPRVLERDTAVAYDNQCLTVADIRAVSSAGPERDIEGVY